MGDVDARVYTFAAMELGRCRVISPKLGYLSPPPKKVRILILKKTD